MKRNPGKAAAAGTGRPARPLTRRGLLQGTIALAVVAAAPAARAHAVIVEAKPKSGETVSGRELNVRLRFNSRIDRRRSRLVLIAPDKKEKTILIVDDPALDVLIGKTTLNASGAYRMRWQVLAIDGHITRGDINFTVVGA